MTEMDIDITSITPHPKAPKGKAQLIRDIKDRHPELSNVQIGKLTDTTAANVCMVLQRYGIVHQEIQDYKSNRADILAGLQHRILTSISEDDLKKAPIQVKLMGYGILYDKERLERGQSTHNLSSISLIIQEIEAKQADKK
jgi:hypothetical protein